MSDDKLLIEAVRRHGGLKRLNRFIINAVLEQCQRPSEAAKALGVCKKTIYNWKTGRKP